MRIQHNIAALSAYRNLTNNNSAVSKNLEKLSSGYRINRAGDDAAGLAISEKMRAQITGLETAQKNANDGISLIQTAEGALTEVHSMLNRMVELANQAANGTYMDDDRKSLQAEVTALLDEIDRISKSTNFNGRTLLDGSQALESKGSQIEVGDIGELTAVDITHIADGAQAKNPQKGIYELDLSDVKIANNGAGNPTPTITGPTSNAVTVVNGQMPMIKAAFTLDLAGAAITAAKEEDGTTVVADQTATFSIAGHDVTLDVTADMTDQEIATALIGKSFEIDGVTYTAKAGGNDTSVKFEAPNGKATTFETANQKATITGGNSGNDELAVGVQVKLGEYELDLTDLAVGLGEKTDGKTIAAKFMENIAANDNKVTIGDEEFTVSNADGKLTFTMVNEPSKDFTEDLSAKLTILDKDGNAIDPGTAGDDFTESGIYINQGEAIGVNIIQDAIYGGERALAQGKFDLADIGLSDGTVLKIGDTTYTFAVGKDSKVDKKGSNVVDLTDYDAEAEDLAIVAAKRLSNIAKDDAMFKVTSDNKTSSVLLTENPDSKIDYNDYDLEGATSKNRGDITEGAWKDLVQYGTMALEEKTVEAKGGLTLQIGDTSDSFNKLTIGIDSMSAKALNIKDIDISTQKGAQEAVDKIKAAINTVSAQRGDLGALQNRLEHTINNLSVTTENITAAESRIRDVDMANEMMAYTKNNILVQASQAMLAQANQIPQGVLQLLQ